MSILNKKVENFERVQSKLQQMGANMEKKKKLVTQKNNILWSGTIRKSGGSSSESQNPKLFWSTLIYVNDNASI